MSLWGQQRNKGDEAAETVREGEMPLKIYLPMHPEAAAVANALNATGLRRPDTGEPLSEALVFGVAGGLGTLYILWEWEA